MIESASGISRLLSCPASSVLPRVYTSNEAAKTGTDIHTFLERAIHIGKEEALKHVGPEIYDRCAKVDVLGIIKDYTGIETEMAYAIDPLARTARFIGRSLGRDYAGAGVVGTEIAGSEDIVAFLGDTGKRCVADFKTGEYVGAAKTNSQLMFFAASLYLIESANEVDVRIIYINDDGSHWIDKASVGPMEIEEYLDKLESATKSYLKQKELFLSRGVVNVSPGDHCTYCPGMAHCPAQTGLVRRMIPELSEVDDMLTALSPETAGRAWDLKKKIGKLYDKVSDGLKEYAKNYGIPLESGKTVGVTEFTKRFFSEDSAIDLLSQLGATKSQIASCYRHKKVQSVRELSKKGK